MRIVHRHSRWMGLGLALLLACGLGYAIWYRIMANQPHGGGMAAMMGKGLPVEATTAVEKPMASTLEVVGQLEAIHGAMLKSEVAAKVLRIGFKDGAKVKAGDVLIQLDDATARATLAQAEANLAVSEANVGRYQRLLEVGAASPLQVDNTTAQAKLARANVLAGKAALAKTRIIAPFDGVAGIARVVVGAMVQAGQDMVAVTDNSAFRMTVTLPEADAAHLVPQSPVGVRIGDDSPVLEGTLEALDGRVDPATRTVAAKISLKTPDDVPLTNGQFVRVEIPTRVDAHATVVPDSALVAEGDKTFIYVLTPGPKGMVMASKTTVTVGLRAQNEAQIVAGLAAGQRVVSAGQQKMMAPVMPVIPTTPTVVVRAQPAVETLSTVSK